jgi:hypothetical protein
MESNSTSDSVQSGGHKVHALRWAWKKVGNKTKSSDYWSELQHYATIDLIYTTMLITYVCAHHAQKTGSVSLLFIPTNWLPSTLYYCICHTFNNEYRRCSSESENCLQATHKNRVNKTWLLRDQMGMYNTENTAVGIRHADHVAPSIRKSWKSLRRQATVAR